MAVNVRLASPEDGDAVLALMPRLADFDLPPNREPEHLWMHDAALFERWLESEAERQGCRVHVATADTDAVIGVAIVTLRPELLSRAPSAHLEAIAVAPGQEGRGVGMRLLEVAERDARSLGAESMTLHVFAANQRARSLYEKAGYDGELLRYIKPLHDDGKASP